MSEEPPELVEISEGRKLLEEPGLSISRIQSRGPQKEKIRG